jgi:predicted nucleic acid-binding protein
LDKPIILDTCVLVDFLRGYKKAVTFVISNQDRIALSPIVLAELHAGARDDDEIAELDRLPVLFPIILVSAEIARLGGSYMRAYSKSHGLGFADAILAATATTQEAILKTLNTKHYPMLKGLRPAYRK